MLVHDYGTWEEVTQALDEIYENNSAFRRNQAYSWDEP
jgi:hypothetical protein